MEAVVSPVPIAVHGEDAWEEVDFLIGCFPQFNLLLK